MIPSTKKQRQLIAIGCSKLGIDADMRHEMLAARFGVASSTLLSAAQAEAFLRELRGKGFKKQSRHRGKPRNMAGAPVDRRALLKKIEAYLAEAKRPWNYAHAMARRMFRVERVQWCDADQLRRMVAALEYDARRHGRFTG